MFNNSYKKGYSLRYSCSFSKNLNNRQSALEHYKNCN